MSRNRALTPLCFLWMAGACCADAYDDARQALFDAYQASDFAAMRAAAGRALDARPGYPGALFNLAYATALHGDSQAALDILSRLASQGVDYGAGTLDEFAALQELPGWSAYAAEIAALQQAIGTASVAFMHDVSDFVPEGIALLDGDLLLGSIRHGSIVRIGAETELLSDARAAGHWSVFGMRVGPDGGVWFGSAAVPEFAGIDAAEVGATGLFRLDPDTGRITEKALLPMQGAARVLGDLVFADDETIYASESLTGALYRYTLGSGELVEVIAPGRLRSLQGLALDAGGDHLYVADYIGGLFRIRLEDYSIRKVTADAASNLFGIDGLYRYGNELIAIQNRFPPHRIVAFTLGADGVSITGSRILARNLPEFDEPTLGTIDGDDFLFVANSHWNRFDRDGNLATGLDGPVILRISLQPRD